MGPDRDTTPLKGLEDQSMHEKTQTSSQVLFRQSLVIVLKQIAVRLEAMPVVALDRNDRYISAGLWVKSVMITEHQFDQ